MSEDIKETRPAEDEPPEAVKAASKAEAAKTKAQLAEESIRKRFHRSLFSKFTRAIKDYQLLAENDRVAVCISGGKDSMLMAKLFQELKRHNRYPFELVFMCMDPGYTPANRKQIEDNARDLEIPITFFETNIFNAVYKIDKSPCYLCARMRRGYLYNKAKELGCNKIALGHHYDDVIETTLMGMLYGGQIETMMPKAHSEHFEGMQLIRPMYLISEADIIGWRKANDLTFLQCACRFTEECSAQGLEWENRSKRREIKQLIAQLKKVNRFVESNIFRSTQNVNLDTLIAWNYEGERHSFLDTYDQKGAIPASKKEQALLRTKVMEDNDGAGLETQPAGKNNNGSRDGENYS